MTEHHAISRRAFTLGLGLAALSPLASLPETAAPGIPLRTAFADNTPAPSDSLDNFVIRLRPAGYFRTASVNQDGNVRGNVCHLFNDGTSSKLILENVTTKNDDTNWYAIRTLLNFEEHKKTGYSIWSVDDDSDKDGKVIHVWGGEYDNKPSRAFAFERQSNGTYIIRDRTVEKETEKKDIKYLAIESDGKDQDNNKICHKSKSIPWELELVGYDMGKINTTVRSIDWTTYSSYVDGPCWMKYVDDNKYLDELSIPGTHDSGTCSVDNDTEPQSSQAKCQQDYIPTQLLEGIRSYDPIRCQEPQWPRRPLAIGRRGLPLNPSRSAPGMSSTPSAQSHIRGYRSAGPHSIPSAGFPKSVEAHAEGSARTAK